MQGSWYGYLCVLAAMGIALWLLRTWGVQWSERLSQTQRFRIGCLGSVGALLVIGIGNVVSATVGRAYSEVIGALTCLLAGVGWLFFGNILLSAIWPSERR